MALQRLELTNSSMGMDALKYWQQNGELELNPPYQRGVIWGQARQRNLIKSVLQGIPIGALIINDRFNAGWPNSNIMYAVIDGKQRVSTLLDFMTGTLPVPAWWFGVDQIASYAQDAEEITWNGLTIPTQRKFRNRPLAMMKASLPTLEMEREVFDLVNFGGVPQGESDA